MTPPRRPRIQLFPVLGGLVFLAVAVLYLLQAAGVLRLDSRLVLPLGAAGLVVAGLLAAVYSARPRRDASQESSDR
ncbi:hypothetical protein [Streptacidiphilus neutrinimicus]|uniref:hypothetical protein n=1 Tax=Streptacidiphilus neutrinimicus TaxID=105420 RepID=UPI0005A6B07C|nr:hypothetical protein [Streptacidiphilus neutrinimicus]